MWSFSEENNILSSSSIKRLSHFLKFSLRLAMLTGSRAYRGKDITCRIKIQCIFKTFLCIHWPIFVVTMHISYICLLIITIRTCCWETSLIRPKAFKHTAQLTIWNEEWNEGLCTFTFHWDHCKELPNSSTEGIRSSSQSSSMFSHWEFHSPENKMLWCPVGQTVSHSHLPSKW